MSEISLIIQDKDPSPVNKITLFFFNSEAEIAAGTDQPIAVLLKS